VALGFRTPDDVQLKLLTKLQSPDYEIHSRRCLSVFWVVAPCRLVYVSGKLYQTTRRCNPEHSRSYSPLREPQIMLNALILFSHTADKNSRNNFIHPFPSNGSTCISADRLAETVCKTLRPVRFINACQSVNDNVLAAGPTGTKFGAMEDSEYCGGFRLNRFLHDDSSLSIIIICISYPIQLSPLF
jgi:hypothetical protein